MENEDAFGSGVDHLENSCIIIDTVLEYPILLGKVKILNIVSRILYFINVIVHELAFLTE